MTLLYDRMWVETWVRPDMSYWFGNGDPDLPPDDLDHWFSDSDKEKFGLAPTRFGTPDPHRMGLAVSMKDDMTALQREEQDVWDRLHSVPVPVLKLPMPVHILVDKWQDGPPEGVIAPAWDEIWIEDPVYPQADYVQSVRRDDGGWTVNHWELTAGSAPEVYLTGERIRVSPQGLWEGSDYEDDSNYDPTGYGIMGVMAIVNCKNIEVVDRHPDSRLSAKRRKHRGVPLFSYKMLRIGGPMKRSVRGQSNVVDFTAYHLTRGHVKTYSEEHPLFGQHVGSFWWMPHMAGNPKAGIAIRDYELAEPS